MTDPNTTPANSPTPGRRKSGGLPLWSVLVGLLILALVGVASLGAFLYLARSDKAKTERAMEALKAQQARDKLAAQKVEEASKLSQSRTSQEQLLAQVRTATNVLERLLREVKQINADAEELKTSQTGQRVAQFGDLVAQARRFYERDLPGLPAAKEVVVKLEGMRRTEQQLLAALGTTFQPDSDATVSVQNANFWGAQQLDDVAKVKAMFSSLVQETKVKVSDTALSANSPTLEATMNRMAQAEATFRQQTILQATSQATTQAVDTVALAESQRIVEKARLEASNILAQVNEAKAQQQREELVRKGEQKVEDTKAKVQSQKAADEARNIELRKKASDPEIQAKLAPFTTPGYWRPKSMTYDKKPHSYTQIQSAGALDPSIAGLRKLATLAMAPADRVRPRWKLRPHWANLPNELEKVKEAQQLLIELGPVLVEMQLLDQ